MDIEKMIARIEKMKVEVAAMQKEVATEKKRTDKKIKKRNERLEKLNEKLYATAPDKRDKIQNQIDAMENRVFDDFQAMDVGRFTDFAEESIAGAISSLDAALHELVDRQKGKRGKRVGLLPDYKDAVAVFDNE